MRILELYSGTQSIGKEFKKLGHTVLSVEVDDKFTRDPYCLDQWTISIADVTAKEVIKRLGGAPDVIWASPLCTTFSMAASSGNHRQKINGLIHARSVKAHLHDSFLIKTLELIAELNPRLYFIENPQGGMKNSWIMQDMNNKGIYTVTYCQYGDTRMKPTNIWTNHHSPKFKPRCYNGDTCHESAPRGSKTGTQGLNGSTNRSVIPEELCKHIVEISEE